jgi:hypothetical protein
MRRALTVFSLGFLLVFAGASTGCILAAAGLGVGVAHAVADEADHFDRPASEVEPAARRALELVGGTYKKTERKDDGVKIMGTLAIEDEVENVVIGVWDKKGKPTKVEVRIGTFGYEDASKEILALIGSELGVEPRESTVEEECDQEPRER